jgi:hypothetical protein
MKSEGRFERQGEGALGGISTSCCWCCLGCRWILLDCHEEIVLILCGVVKMFDPTQDALAAVPWWSCFQPAFEADGIPADTPTLCAPAPAGVWVRRQYHYVLQSLTLWREIMTDMFKLWYLAESDMLREGNSYRLCDTGQGLNRVQPAPQVKGGTVAGSHCSFGASCPVVAAWQVSQTGFCCCPCSGLSSLALCWIPG